MTVDRVSGDAGADSVSPPVSIRSGSPPLEVSGGRCLALASSDGEAETEVVAGVAGADPVTPSPVPLRSGSPPPEVFGGRFWTLAPSDDEAETEDVADVVSSPELDFRYLCRSPSPVADIDLVEEPVEIARRLRRRLEKKDSQRRKALLRASGSVDLPSLGKDYMSEGVPIGRSSSLQQAPESPQPIPVGAVPAAVASAVQQMEKSDAVLPTQAVVPGAQQVAGLGSVPRSPALSLHCSLDETMGCSLAGASPTPGEISQLPDPCWERNVASSPRQPSSDEVVESSLADCTQELAQVDAVGCSATCGLREGSLVSIPLSHVHARVVSPPVAALQDGPAVRSSARIANQSDADLSQLEKAMKNVHMKNNTVTSGYLLDGPLDQAVGSPFSYGAAGCYGFWMYTAPDGHAGYLVPGWVATY